MTPATAKKLRKETLTQSGRLQLALAWQQAKRRAHSSRCISPALSFDGNFTRTEVAQQQHADLTFDQLKRWARMEVR